VMVLMRHHGILPPIENEEEEQETRESVCQIVEGENTCAIVESRKTNMPIETNEQTSDQSSAREDDLSTAARYYRMAAEETGSPRANFNLGFMYEWGLGVKQDFPLAKRHYDLAVAGRSLEADVPVSMARLTMSLHEYYVKQMRAWKDRRNADSPALSPTSPSEVPAMLERKDIGHPVPGQSELRTKTDVIISHLLTWESLLILLLTVLLSILLRHRTRGR
jgi:SEL1 protein